MQQYGFTLEPGETVTRVWHRYWIDLLPSMASAGFLGLFALAIVYVDARFSASIPFSHVMVLSLALVIIVLAVLIFLLSVYVFNRNVLIFTTQRLVEVEQVGLVDRTVSQVSFTRVQDVTATRDGLFPTLLNYGDVEIQSAGEQEKFMFHNVSDPQGVANAARLAHEQSLQQMPAPAAQSSAAV